MELRARDVAKLLGISEHTVYRWARDGSLPSHRIGEQYRFNRVELQEWAATHRHEVSPELFAAPGAPEAEPSLAAALERGGVHTGIHGERREDVLAAISELPGVPPGVNRALLRQLLIGRETLASTAVGDGIAIPHPRDPLVIGVDEPHVLLCFLERPVDFGAMDGQPVRVLFVLLTPSVRQHLHVLARLAFALHDPELRALLNRTAPKQAILDRIRTLESSAGAPPAPSAVPASRPVTR